MTNTINNKWLELVSGDRAHHLDKFSPKSRKKAFSIAWLILIPIGIWVASGYIMGREFLDMGIWSSTLLALIMGLIIFLIERSIITLDGNNWMKGFRILLALLSALLGGEMINSQFFKKDIDKKLAQKAGQMAEYKSDSLTKVLSNQTDKLQEQAHHFQNEYINSKNNYLKEIDGSGGSRKRGVGIIADEKLENALEQKENWANAVKELKASELARDSLINDLYIRSYKSEIMVGPIEKLTLLHEVAFSSSNHAFVFCLFSFLLLILELIVLIYKISTRATAYEVAVKMKDEYEIRQLIALKERSLEQERRNRLQKMTTDLHQLKALI